MRDVFGADTGTISEGAPAAAPPAPAMTSTGVPLATAPAPGTASPTLAQAVDKAVAKASADKTVATDPQATHAVNLSATHPNVLGATAAGAAAGSFIPGIGTAVGAAIGFVSSKYQIAGDPLGKAAGKGIALVKSFWEKISAPAKLPSLKLPVTIAAAPPAAPPSGTGTGTGS